VSGTILAFNKYRAIKSEYKEEAMNMIMEQNPEADMNNKTMEEMLIEIFGCISPDKKVVKIYTGRRAKRIKTEFYHAGSAMEMMLIEIFGCKSVNGNAIKFVCDRERKRINPDWNADDQDTMPLSVNA
jgi:hypothetical protein